eukprot:CAMPEP_0118812358 /NCGR_PEP_ID=MMETSP1162-20130426/2242_1 /TAXON_ID=33656 /ORGANISM="Phaeocystis Sp, Strain CCMP2710" /LENGTH=91 /DNA_ID=CAMNT_0006742077 /DNA_START=25 /DNA_END=300 /DNA_ORIENTATION=+
MSLTGQEKLETAPTDKRFPTTNQAKHCYMYYNSWHQCKYDHSDEEPQCQKLRQWTYSMCPVSWIEGWETQRENGTYPGPVPGEVKAAPGHH